MTVAVAFKNRTSSKLQQKMQWLKFHKTIRWTWAIALVKNQCLLVKAKWLWLWLLTIFISCMPKNNSFKSRSNFKFSYICCIFSFLAMTQKLLFMVTGVYYECGLRLWFCDYHRLFIWRSYIWLFLWPQNLILKTLERMKKKLHEGMRGEGWSIARPPYFQKYSTNSHNK